MRLSVVLVVLGAAPALPAAAGIIAYDTITNYAPTEVQKFISTPLQADDTTLAPGAGLVINKVSVLARLRSGATSAQFDGTLTLRLYSSGTDHRPGALLHQVTRPVLLDRAVDQVVSFDIPSIVAPSASIWTAWYFAQGADFSMYNDIWVRQSTSAPAPGSTTPALLSGQPGGPPSNWLGTSETQRNYAIRIETVPGPASVLSLLVLAVRRRR